MSRSGQKRVAAALALPVAGVIFCDALYRIDELKARLGWGDLALRAAFRRGLPVHRCGRRAYVLGSELLEFIAAQGQEGGDA
jgi:hypothetical protein